MNNIFYSHSLGRLTLEQIVAEIVKFINEDKEKIYHLTIGTDSAIRKGETLFVTAIVLHRVGYGGRYFWAKLREKGKNFLRDRIYREALLSVELADQLVPLVKQATIDGLYEFQIHIDIGPNGATRDMISELTGMVIGFGYEAKTKPNSYGASVIADRHT